MQFLRKFKSFAGPIWWNTLLMFIASRMGDVITLYIGMFIVPDVVDTAQLGAVLPVTRLATLFALPLLFVLTGALKYINIFYNDGEAGKVKALIRDISLFALVMSIISLSAMWTLRDFIMVRLKIEDFSIFLVIAGLTVMSFWNPLASVAAQSLKRFKTLIAAKVVGPVARLIGILLLLGPFQLTGYLSAQLIMFMAVFALLVGAFWNLIKPSVKSIPYRQHRREMLRYTIPVGITTIAIALQLLIEPWVVRQRLPEVDSAAFYIIVTFGQIPLWVAPAMLPFLFPIVSEKHERGEETHRIHQQALFITLLIGMGITLGFLLFGNLLLSLRESWSKYQDYSHWLWVYSLISTLTTFVSAHYTYENARRRFRYLWYLIPIYIFELTFLYSAWVIPFCRPLTQDPMTFIMACLLISRVLVTLGIFIDGKLIQGFIYSVRLRLPNDNA